MANIFKAKSLISRTGVFSNEVIAPNLVYNTGEQFVSGFKKFDIRPTVNGTGILLSGEAASLPVTIVYTTGNQTISGTKTFANNLEVQGTGIFNALDLSNISEFNFSGTNINLISGNVNISGQIYISGNPVLTGVNLSSYATTANLASTGSTLATNLAGTGSTLVSSINSLSGLFTGFTGNLDAAYATDTQLANTGSTLQTKINDLSGVSVLTFGDQTISGIKTFEDSIKTKNIISSDNENLLISGFSSAMVGSDINIIPGKSSFSKGSINLTAAGDQIDGNINLKGNIDVNNYGQSVPDGSANSFEIYKSGSNEYNQRVSIKSFEVNQNGVYTLNKTPIYADAQIYISGNPVSTGVDLSSYATTSNLASTGLNLSNNISSLSGLFTGFTGNLDATFASDIQLANTGSTLVNSINSLSGLFTGFTGSLDASFATDTQLANTGSTIVNSISSLSGTLTSTYATINNLASTGSTLQSNINSLSGYVNSTSSNIVFTTGNQNIGGNKTFTGVTTFSGQQVNIIDTALNLSGLGDMTFEGTNINFINSPVFISGTNLRVSGTVLANNLNNLAYTTGNQNISGTKTFNVAPIISGNPFITGDLSLYATTTNLASTGLTLTNNITSLSGLFTGFTGNLDSTFASDTQLANTGSTLDLKINSLSGSLNTSGINLINSINSLSGLFTGYTGDVDSTFATDIQLQNTGSTLSQNINSLSGTLTNDYYLKSNPSGFITGVDLSSYATTSNLALTGLNLSNNINSLSGLFTGYTGSLDATFASDIQLANTGSNLDTKINNLSGVSVLRFGDQTISGVKTFETGVNISGHVGIGIDSNNFNLYVRKSSAGAVNPDSNSIAVFEGSGSSHITVLGSDAQSAGVVIGSPADNFASYLTWNHDNNELKLATASPGGYIQLLTNTETQAVRITSTGNVGIGTISPSEKLQVVGNILANNLVYNTGNQNISGIKTFDVFPIVSGNELITGVDLSSYATTTNLASTGSTLATSINSLSGLFTGFTGALDATFASDIQLASTGSTLQTNIDNLSNTYATITNVALTGSTLATNIASTGSTLQTNIDNLSNTYATITNVALTGSTLATNIASTGSTLQTNIDNLSNTYATITNVALTGSTLATNIASTGSTLQTNINNLSNTYATITNLASTGSTLNTKIDNLSGSSVLLYGDQSIGGIKTFRDNVYINNLFVTGTETIVNTPQINIASNYLLLNLTGGAVDGGIFFVTGSGLTGINDAGPIIGFDHSNKFKFGVSTRNSDHSTLPDIASVQDIEAYSGVADGKFSTITNLASTGSTLNTRINNLSGYINSSSSNIVFTTGNQTISGTKTFIQDATFGDTGQGDFLVISGNNFTVYGSGNFTSGLFVNGNPVFTGSPNSIVYITGNQTISGVKTFIGNHNISGDLNVTGNSNIRGTLDVTGLVVSGLGTPFILKSPNNSNSVYFDPTLNGNAGILYSNYLATIGLQSLGDQNLSIGYGGGGERSIIFTKSSINRAILDSNGNFGVGSGISSVPSRFYVSGDSILQGDLTVSGTLTTNQRPFVNGTGVLLSGEAAQVDLSTTVRTTGNQTVSGIKDFQSIPEVSGKDIYYQKDVYYFTGNNFTPDSNIARTFEYILTGLAGASATLNAPINMFNGENIVIKIKQSSNGSNNLIFNAAYKFPGGVIPSLTLTPSKADIYTALKIDSNFYSTYVKDFIN